MNLKLLLPLLISTQILSAQTFTELTPTPFPSVLLSAVAFVDVDGDSDQDVLITGIDDQNLRIAKLYTNDGSGHFTESIGTPFDGIRFGSIAFADIDGDSDQDVLITGSNNDSEEIAKLYTNDGDGNFSELIGTPFDGVQFGSIAFADVDGDSDQDVLITGSTSDFEEISKLYQNDGDGNFSELIGTPFDGVTTSSIAFADVDGDNDLDVLITGKNNDLEPIAKLYSNDGLGNYTEVIGTTLVAVSRSAIAFADIDGDGDQDVLITGEEFSPIPATQLYTNDGLGNFTEIVDFPFSFLLGVQSGSVAFADIDEDGDQDVLITGSNFNGLEHVAKLFTNDGLGNFTEITGTPFIGVRGSIAFADVDGDNDQDVLLTGFNNDSEGVAKLYINDGLVNTNNHFLNANNFDFTLSPNPTIEDRIYIDFEAVQSSEVAIKIFSVEGHLLIRENNPSIIGEQSFSINISSLKKGSYFIELFDGKKRRVRKSMVQ